MTSSTLIYAKNQKRWQIQMRFVYRQVLWPACADISYIVSLYRSHYTYEMQILWWLRARHLYKLYIGKYNRRTMIDPITLYGMPQEAHRSANIVYLLHASSIFSRNSSNDTNTYISYTVYMLEKASVILISVYRLYSLLQAT